MELVFKLAYLAFSNVVFWLIWVAFNRWGSRLGSFPSGLARVAGVTDDAPPAWLAEFNGRRADDKVATGQLERHEDAGAKGTSGQYPIPR